VTKVVVVGVALAIGVGVIGMALTVRDDDPGQVATYGTETTAPASGTAPGLDADPTTTPPRGSSPSALDGPVLDVSDRSVAPGETISVGGSGCGVQGPAPVGSWEVRVWLAPAPGTVPWDPSFGDPVATVAPDPGGRWQVDLTVPAWSTDYRLEAACFDQATPPAGFLYRHERVVASPDTAG
jgi:hypothetical protein